ncbi:unnamed protein product [Haemonchus placei]|uniref:G_PROTEIN_RECEP_F1_2 domain-containing protein n=1 Tax=Haemonchus placei TaxID=6290 RepID=A0A158QKW3_HAEPC|nr:unnamed protein product [Haemonchus placei]
MSHVPFIGTTGVLTRLQDFLHCGSWNIFLICPSRKCLYFRYITTCSVIIFIVPVLVIFYCYYKVFCKLREAAKGSRRLQRSTTTRTSYQRVTRSVQRVVLFHLLCWTPFWLFNLFSSIFRVRITSQLERIVVNIIHLFPYVNCALNPLLYAYRAENFRIAFKTMFISTFRYDLHPSNAAWRSRRGRTVA